ncbi:MAG: hypothetical protein ABIJ26_01650, partial [Candidatus Margulisiibacteriota bacterium]
MKKMKHGQYAGYFLRPECSLAQTIRDDADFLKAKRIDPKNIGQLLKGIVSKQPLLTEIRNGASRPYYPFIPESFERYKVMIGSVEYEVERIAVNRHWYCPWWDSSGCSTNLPGCEPNDEIFFQRFCDYIVRNPASQKQIRFNGLLIHMIDEHSFFCNGGPEYSFSMSPESIVNFFSLTAGDNPQVEIIDALEEQNRAKLLQMRLAPFGLTLKQLFMWEHRMQPRMLSIGGFMGSNERLIDILEADARTVRAFKGQIVEILRLIMHSNLVTEFKFLVNGKTFSAKRTTYMGSQECFCDEEFTDENSFARLLHGERYHKRNSNSSFKVISPEGNKLIIPGLILHLIEDHCFFEGPGSPYRVDPQELISFFSLSSNGPFEIAIVESPEYLYTLSSNFVFCFVHTALMHIKSKIFYKFDDFDLSQEIDKVISKFSIFCKERNHCEKEINRVIKAIRDFANSQSIDDAEKALTNFEKYLAK